MILPYLPSLGMCLGIVLDVSLEVYLGISLEISPKISPEIPVRHRSQGMVVSAVDGSSRLQVVPLCFGAESELQCSFQMTKAREINETPSKMHAYGKRRGVP